MMMIRIGRVGISVIVAAMLGVACGDDGVTSTGTGTGTDGSTTNGSSSSDATTSTSGVTDATTSSGSSTGVTEPTSSTTDVSSTSTTGAPPVCGDGNVDAGEDCDDGNVESCDECPASCRFAPVACPTAGRYAQTIHLVRGDAQPLTSALFCLAYPVGTVALPGSGLVTQRVSGFPGLTTVNDFDDAARVALVGQQQLAAIDATISFDLCVGASAPPPTTFVCDVISASNAGTAVDPTIVDCAPMTPVTP